MIFSFALHYGQAFENTESWGITKDAKRQFLCDSIYVKNRDESRAEGTRGRFWRMQRGREVSAEHPRNFKQQRRTLPRDG